MTEIFVCRPGTVTDEVKLALEQSGIVLIEMEDPTAFRFVRAQPEIDGGAMLSCALDALTALNDDPGNRATRNRSVFVTLLAKAVADRQRDLQKGEGA